MKPVDSNVHCPSCQRALRPKLLACDDCGIKVEGPFQLNEFATLPPEDLHLLRIFVLSEGRIRDMEAPLGLSYPTIRVRLRSLREKIGGTTPPAEPSRGATPAPGKKPDDAAVSDVLAQLSAGTLSFDEAMSQIKRAREPKK